MKFNFIVALIVLCCVSHPVFSVELPGIPEFIDEMVAKHQMRRDELEQVFSRAQHKPSIIDAITRPATKKPWLEYRAAFVNTQRVQRGLVFWRNHAPSLRRAAKQYGVPEEIIVAIIGVETIYGKNAGNFRIVDALTTLAFDYPRRAEFFRSELENYLLLVREQQFNLLGVRGSYAGAMGIPQFMPSSYRKYAVDFNGNHKVDLLHEEIDAIGSVANYMQGYGWLNEIDSSGAKRVKGQPPIAILTKFVAKDWLNDAPRETHTLKEWAAMGFVVDETLPKNLTARLADYTVEDGKELWLVFNNFEVITRYNNSDFYAMSVFQLAEKLKEARHANFSR